VRTWERGIVDRRRGKGYTRFMGKRSVIAGCRVSFSGWALEHKRWGVREAYDIEGRRMSGHGGARTSSTLLFL